MRELNAATHVGLALLFVGLALLWSVSWKLVVAFVVLEISRGIDRSWRGVA